MFGGLGGSAVFLIVVYVFFGLFPIIYVSLKGDNNKEQQNNG